MRNKIIALLFISGAQISYAQGISEGGKRVIEGCVRPIDSNSNPYEAMAAVECVKLALHAKFDFKGITACNSMLLSHSGNFLDCYSVIAGKVYKSPEAQEKLNACVELRHQQGFNERVRNCLTEAAD